MSERIGQQLRQARESRQLSLEQVAQATHIRIHYLRAIESGDWQALPSATQARGFIRMIAGFLDLDLDTILSEEIPVQLPEAGDQLSDADQLSSVPEEITQPKESDRIPLPANTIFSEIGKKLRAQREILGLSVEDVERHTHLRVHLLKALESGDIKSLPSPVQGRGMLSNYATFLGLDPEPLLLRFAEGLQARLAARQEGKPSKRKPFINRPWSTVSPLRRFFSLDFLIGGLVLISLVGFIFWGIGRVSWLRGDDEKATPTPTAPSVADILLNDPTLEPTPTSTPRFTPTTAGAAIMPVETFIVEGEDPGLESSGTPNATEESAVAPPASSTAPIQVFVIARQRTWMRVTVDGEVEFQGRVTPGSNYPFYGDERVEILTGSGSALQVFYNQTNLGILGAYGEVVLKVFTLQGIQQPTATPTPTITPTAPTTPTLEATPTTQTNE